MGISTYLGPYVECQTSVVDADVSRRECQNGHRPGYASYSFCPMCGSKILDVAVKVRTRNVNRYAVRDEVKEVLLGYEIGDKDFWVAGQDFCGRDCQVGDDDYEGVVDLDPVAISAELEQFQHAFGKEIGVLIEKYGESSVKVRWGLVRYD